MGRVHYTGYTDSEYETYNKAKDDLPKKTIAALKDLLLTNRQRRTGNKAELIERIADCKTLGAIPKCPKCGGGWPRYCNKTAKYSCEGYHDDDKWRWCKGKWEGATSIVREKWQD